MALRMEKSDKKFCIQFFNFADMLYENHNEINCFLTTKLIFYLWVEETISNTSGNYFKHRKEEMLLRWKINLKSNKKKQEENNKKRKNSFLRIK